jgi:hypothetical protein
MSRAVRDDTSVDCMVGRGNLHSDVIQVACAIVANPALCPSRINTAAEAREIAKAAVRVVLCVARELEG